MASVADGGLWNWRFAEAAKKMKRYKAFLKQTWWLWLGYVAVAAGLIYFVAPVFWAVIPMMVVNFFYFAIVRYDEDGNFLGA